ncbi:hypothetical protein ACWCXB_32790 [Streptomyces sp. NPDC001514]
MSSHAALSPQEAADRPAIRELIDAYAHCGDRGDAKGQMARQFVKQGGDWFFAERRLLVDWTETRPCAP